MARLLVIFIFILAGCTPLGIPESNIIAPDHLSTKGLLVATIVGGSGNLSHMSKPDHMLRVGTYNLKINEKLYHPNYYGQTFILSLSPGSYNLSEISDSAGRFEINKNFIIRPGKITSLGGMFFDEIPGAAYEGFKKSVYQFNLISIDNEETVYNVISKARSDLFDSLSDKKIYKAEIEFLSEDKLNALRKEIALSQIFFSNRRLIPNKVSHETFVTGILGIAGWVLTDIDGKPQTYLPLKLETLQNVEGCDTKGKRFACLLAPDWSFDFQHRRILVGNDKEVKNLETPSGVTPNALHLFGENGIVVGNLGYGFTFKEDEQSDWQVFSGPEMLKKQIYYDFYFANTSDGFYTYIDGKEHFLTFTDVATNSVEISGLPKDFGGGTNILETTNGIIIGPEFNLFSKSRVFLRSNNGQWSAITLPNSRCGILGRSSDNLDSLFVLCASMEYRSTDGGYTWNEVSPFK